MALSESADSLLYLLLWHTIFAYTMRFVIACETKSLYPSPYDEEWCGDQHFQLTKSSEYKIILADSELQVMPKLSDCVAQIHPAPGDTAVCVSIDTYFSNSFGNFGFIIRDASDYEDSTIIFGETTKQLYKSRRYNREYCTFNNLGLFLYFTPMQHRMLEAARTNMSLSVKTISSPYRQAYFISPCNSNIKLSNSHVRILNRPPVDRPINGYYGVRGSNPTLNHKCLYTAVKTATNRSICFAFKWLGGQRLSCGSKWRITTEVSYSLPRQWRTETKVLGNITCDLVQMREKTWCYPSDVDKVVIEFQRDQHTRLHDVEKERPMSFVLVVADYQSDNLDAFLKNTTRDVDKNILYSEGCDDSSYWRSLKGPQQRPLNDEDKTASYFEDDNNVLQVIGLAGSLTLMLIGEGLLCCYRRKSGTRGNSLSPTTPVSIQGEESEAIHSVAV